MGGSAVASVQKFPACLHRSSLCRCRRLVVLFIFLVFSSSLFFFLARSFSALVARMKRHSGAEPGRVRQARQADNTRFRSSCMSRSWCEPTGALAVAEALLERQSHSAAVKTTA